MKAMPTDDHTKDIDFSRSTIAVRWKAGSHDAGRALRDFATYLPTQAIPAIAGFLVLPLLARKLTPTELGVLAIAQTLDAASNVAAMARMLRLASAPRLVVPGHDPQVFARFPVPGGRVARID
mgnify:CR=1 FL=1